MARTPDVAGALAAVIARTLKSTVGPRLRKVDSQLRKLERRLRKIASQRGRRAGAGRRAAAGRRRSRRGRSPMRARERARSLGASYADVRINRYRTQSVLLRSTPDWTTGAVNNVPSVTDEESFGFGVRVIHSGAWGFAASSSVDQDTMARMAAEAV